MNKPQFIDLNWHIQCTQRILKTHQQNGVMILKGSPKSGKRRFLINLDEAHSINLNIFRCPPCGTEREIFMRLARKIGVSECRESDPRSELVVLERIAERLRNVDTTLAITNAQMMSSSLLKLLIGLRGMVEETGGSLALVLGTTYSPNYFLSQGLREEDVTDTYEIPEINGEEMLGCLRILCQNNVQSLAEGYKSKDEETLYIVQEMSRRNLGRIGFIAEFAHHVLHMAHDSQLDPDLIQTIISGMENDCRKMEVVPLTEKQPELF